MCIRRQRRPGGFAVGGAGGGVYGAFERAESLEKREADAKVRHAQLLVQQGKYVEALPWLRRAHDLKPRDDIQKYLEQVERIAKSRQAHIAVVLSCVQDIRRQLTGGPGLTRN